MENKKQFFCQIFCFLLNVILLVTTPTSKVSAFCDLQCAEVVCVNIDTKWEVCSVATWTHAVLQSREKATIIIER